MVEMGELHPGNSQLQACAVIPWVTSGNVKVLRRDHELTCCEVGTTLSCCYTLELFRQLDRIQERCVQVYTRLIISNLYHPMVETEKRYWISHSPFRNQFPRTKVISRSPTDIGQSAFSAPNHTHSAHCDGCNPIFLCLGQHQGKNRKSWQTRSGYHLRQQKHPTRLPGQTLKLP